MHARATRYAGRATTIAARYADGSTSCPLLLPCLPAPIPKKYLTPSRALTCLRGSLLDCSPQSSMIDHPQSIADADYSLKKPGPLAGTMTRWRSPAYKKGTGMRTRSYRKPFGVLRRTQGSMCLHFETRRMSDYALADHHVPVSVVQVS
jgi:hypothetical protein